MAKDPTTNARFHRPVPYSNNYTQCIFRGNNDCCCKHTTTSSSDGDCHNDSGVQGFQTATNSTDYGSLVEVNRISIWNQLPEFSILLVIFWSFSITTIDEWNSSSTNIFVLFQKHNIILVYTVFHWQITTHVIEPFLESICITQLDDALSFLNSKFWSSVSDLSRMDRIL